MTDDPYGFTPLKPDNVIHAFGGVSPEQAKGELLGEASADRLLLHRAMRELELIRMKDCDAVYDTTLRAEYSASLARK